MRVCSVCLLPDAEINADGGSCDECERCTDFDLGVYCPLGSPSKVSVRSGYYSLNIQLVHSDGMCTSESCDVDEENAQARGEGQIVRTVASGLRTAQQPCEVGFFCPNNTCARPLRLQTDIFVTPTDTPA